MGKLHEQMKADLTLKGYSPCTSTGYLPRCRKFAEHFNRSPEEMGREEIRTFLIICNRRSSLHEYPRISMFRALALQSFPVKKILVTQFLFI